MIPEKGKTYLIDYVSRIFQDDSYNGPAIYTGEMEDDLYIFDIPGEGGYNLFFEEDIVSGEKEAVELFIRCAKEKTKEV